MFGLSMWEIAIIALVFLLNFTFFIKNFIIGSNISEITNATKNGI